MNAQSIKRSLTRVITVAAVAAAVTGGTANVAHAKAPNPSSPLSAVAVQTAAVSVEVRWWGVVLHLNREAGCWAAESRPELEQALNAIPEPYRTLVKGAIALHKFLIGAQMGTDGVDLHISWLGAIHWIGPNGASQRC